MKRNLPAVAIILTSASIAPAVAIEVPQTRQEFVQEIVLYRPTIGVKKIVASLKEWFAGNPDACPKLK